MKIAFLSCKNLDGFVVDDHLLETSLVSDGHLIQTIPWDSDALWSEFDCVIIRTTWDYLERPKLFLEKLKEIGRQTKLYNAAQTIEWNIHKSYLVNFGQRGIPVVPTLIFSDAEKFSLPKEWKENKFVIKPAISAGSHKTMIFSREEIEKEHYKKDLYPGDWMCQPFLSQITEGELSLFYFNKKLSHAVSKVPKAGDFRVQEEFGGIITLFNPSSELLQLGEQILSNISDDLLYARIDLVKYQDQYVVMELELIEPSLYFRKSPESILNFKQALYERSLS